MASSSAGSVQKSTDRRTSFDTVCSSNSSCFLQKRKPINPLARSIRTTVSKSNGNGVTQRVLSAKLLRLRTLQNQLNDANYHLVELAKENRALKTLQKRQDKALSRYEDANADLPRLLKSHEEEIRALQERNKNLRRNVKDLSEQLKIKDEELINVREQLKHILTLTKDKHLGEREKLAMQVEDLKDKLKDSENQINLLNRKLMLETKNTKYKLNQELVKNKQCQKELDQAFREIDRLSVVTENKGKLIGSGRKRFVNVPQRQAISMISLTGNVEDHTDKKQKDILLETEENINVKEKDDGCMEKNIKSILKSPSESIKERLSASIHKEIEQKIELPASILKSPNDSIKERLSSANIHRELEHPILSPPDNKNFDSQLSKSIYTITSKIRSRPSSSQKLEKLKDSSNSNNTSTSNNSLDDNIKQQLDDYRTQVVSSMMSCNKVVDKHRQDFEQAKSETEKLLDSLREADTIDAKLRHNDLLDDDIIKIPEEDRELVNQILNEEYSFRKTVKKSTNVLEDKNDLIQSTDKNGNLTQRSSIAQDDKKKLLATLRAIDNGENIETVTDNSTRKTKLMKELFGSIDQ